MENGRERCQPLLHPTKVTARWSGVKPHPKLHAPPHTDRSCNALAINHSYHAPSSRPACSIESHLIKWNPLLLLHDRRAASIVRVPDRDPPRLDFGESGSGRTPKQREIEPPTVYLPVTHETVVPLAGWCRIASLREPSWPAGAGTVSVLKEASR